MVDLSVDLGGGHRLPNPLMTASGCAANGRELHRFFDVADLGAFVTKSVMADPRSGRGTPRMAETPSGMLNSIGLPNKGLAGFLAEDLPRLAELPVPLIVSAMATDREDFARIVTTLDEREEVAAIELNVSCPNVHSGLIVGENPSETLALLAALRPLTEKPLIVKLTPNVADPAAVAVGAEEGGADGLTMITTLLGMVIDTDRMRPQLGGVTGGLSGPGIRPVAVRAIWQVRQAMFEGRIPTVPIIGVGGVRTGRDALELVAAGASAVQVGTATFNDPTAPVRVLHELTEILVDKGYAHFTDAVAVAHGR